MASTKISDGTVQERLLVEKLWQMVRACEASIQTRRHHPTYVTVKMIKTDYTQIVGARKMLLMAGITLPANVEGSINDLAQKVNHL